MTGLAKLALPGMTMTVQTAQGEPSPLREGGREGGKDAGGRAAWTQDAAPDDARMAAAARRGDRAAWNWLYRRYARLVHGVLVSRVPPADAEDLVQDVFAKAMRTITTVRDDACLGAWLAAVARNRATDFIRQRRRRRTAALDDASEPAASPPVPAERTLDAAEVLAAIRKLPDAYRETLALRLVEGLTGPEIAQRMGMTHGSVRVNLHRGMAMLREALGMEATP